MHSRGRPPTLAFVSLGSNIEPHVNLPAAVRLLAEQVTVRRVSRVYETAPVGNTDQPSFLNAAVLIETYLLPWDLKHDVLRRVESTLKRVRTSDRNGPRTIDLDISLYGDMVCMDPKTGLLLPDPDITSRAHIALPLADLDPERTHPVTGQTLSQIATAVALPGDAREVPLALVA